MGGNSIDSLEATAQPTPDALIAFLKRSDYADGTPTVISLDQDFLVEVGLTGESA